MFPPALGRLLTHAQTGHGWRCGLVYRRGRGSATTISVTGSNGISGGTADNEVGPFPGPLRSVERYLLGHPPGVVGRRPVGGQVSPVDRSACAARAQARRPTSLSSDCTPEAGMLPRDVIGVHDSRPRNRLADPAPPASSSPRCCAVHRQHDRPASHDRTARHGPARATPDKRLDHASQRLNTPRPGLRLLPSKPQTHAPIMPGSPAAAVHSATRTTSTILTLC
jgi:hypothetical protein